ncbi:MAG: hypothetical protein E7354_00940 [Clostridiales bacterium]|nr:hypothetical protein [Clostridiales bacterium]
MRYKNSVKIVFSNFNIAWKSMLYFFLVIVATLGLLYLAISPIYALLASTGFIGEVLEVYANFLSSLNFTELLLSAKTLGVELIDIFTANMSTIWFNFTAIALILGFFVAIVSNLTIVPMCNSLNYYMGSINNYGFYSSFSDTFGKSLKISLIQYFVALPIDAIIIAIFVTSLRLFNIGWWAMSLIAPFVIMITLVILLSLKCTLFASWIPTMVTMNYSVWRSLGVAIKTSFRYFWKVFGTSVGVVLTIFVLNVFLGLFTLGAGFLLSIPTSFLLYSAFGMVVTFEGLGMRYYVDVYNVVTPMKKEKTDRFEDMRYII